MGRTLVSVLNLFAYSGGATLAATALRSPRSAIWMHPRVW